MATELAELWVEVKPSAADKCARCWHRQPDVNANPEYPDVCGRCVENLIPDGVGEKRMFA